MEYFAYIKYEGENIRNGLFGTRDAADALSGLDVALRYVIDKELPELRRVKYDIPVKIQEGSWTGFLPDQIGQYVQIFQTAQAVGAFGLIAISLEVYLKNLAEQAAKEGLLETGPAKDLTKIFRFAVRVVQDGIAYVKHMQGYERKPGAIKISKDGSQITIFNKAGEPLTVDADVFELLIKIPKKVLCGLAKPVVAGRKLRVGLRHGRVWKDQVIEAKDRTLFCEEEEMVDELPELVDGELVSLDGIVVRANEKEQSFGLQYKNHVITCKPVKGKTIVMFKEGIISHSSGKLYHTNVTVHGMVERVTEEGNYKTKPRIFVSEVIPIDTDEDQQGKLF